jgi:hypothetical protein
MGKRSQAKTRWLSMSQRLSKGEAKSGARLWFLNPTQPKPRTTRPIPPRAEVERAEAIQGQAPKLQDVQASQDGLGQAVESPRVGGPA